MGSYVSGLILSEWYECFGRMRPGKRLKSPKIWQEFGAEFFVCVLLLS
jgi:hypothetical protein